MECARQHEHGDDEAALNSEVDDGSSDLPNLAESEKIARLEKIGIVECAEELDSARLDNGKLNAIKCRFCNGDFPHVRSSDATTPQIESELHMLEKMQLENTLLQSFINVKYSKHIGTSPVISPECARLARARFEEQNFMNATRLFLYDRARTADDYKHCIANDAFIPLVKMTEAENLERMQMMCIAAKVRAHHIRIIDAALHSRWQALEIYVAMCGQSEEERFASFLHEEYYKIVDENSCASPVVQLAEYP